MKYSIRKAVVLGSGTMGAAIAAHLANAGVQVVLLDIVPDKLTPDQQAKGLTLQDKTVRNSIVEGGLERAIKARPANFVEVSRASLIQTGNFEDDLGLVAEADWVIEAIIENLAIKQKLMARIDLLRGAKTIVSTNTSGISVHAIADGRSEAFRSHFLGTHFFNPPRYLKLLEVIPTRDTSQDVLDAISYFGEFRLGKGIVLCKDTPNFIGNRIAFGGGAYALDYILENGYTVDEVDSLTGPLLGRPKTATFRLIDLVGVDVWDHVGRNLAEAIPDDKRVMPYLKSGRVNKLITEMIQRGWLGNKAKTGFYTAVTVDGKREFWSLDLQTMEHKAPVKPRFDSVGKAKDIEDLGERLKTLLSGADRASGLARALTYQSLAYASSLIPEVSDTPQPIDNAVRWGFQHEAGPFEIWDLLGVEETLSRIKQAGFEPAEWVDEMINSGQTSFYTYQNGQKAGVYSVVSKKYELFERLPQYINLVSLKSTGKVITENPGASLIDLDDGVLCVEFHTKMNALDDDISNIIVEALDRLNSDFDGLVIGNDAENFSAGANLFLVMLSVQMGQWEQLEALVRKLQNFNMQMRYSPKPIVVAPAGLALGGGSEIMMHASRIVAASELYAGLVEVGSGVIPAGGGTKEMVRRLLNPPMKTQNADPLPHIMRIFEQVGTAKVATSAEEARQMVLLSANDRVVMNRDHLIAEAKKEILHMISTGYQAPVREKVYAAGRDALAALQVGIYMYRQANQITEYDVVVANKLASVITGGELSSPTWVDEQYFLDLEREAFLSLCGEQRTQDRMRHILQTGKPLRN